MPTSLIIDTDTHFTEPEDLWLERLPKAWAEDRVLRVRWDDHEQAEMWTIGDRVLQRAWAACGYGMKRAHSDSEYPAMKSDAHIATTDQSERVKLMDEMGIQTSVLYPNIGGLMPAQFMTIGSHEVATAHLRVYNDYQQEWADNFPSRFIPMLVVPFWDINECVAEIERTAGRGFGGIVMTGAPHVHEEPFLADPHWDPMWQACVDTRLSVSFHIGNGATVPLAGDALAPYRPPATYLGYIAVPNMVANGIQVLDLLLSGILVRFPTLKFVSVESGIGWVPFVLEAADYHFKKSRDERPHAWGDALPSDLFHRQVYVNYWFEDLQQWHVDAIGEDNILFETDFPHPTCLEEHDLEETITRRMAKLPESLREKILWKNATSLYNLPGLK